MNRFEQYEHDRRLREKAFARKLWRDFFIIYAIAFVVAGLFLWWAS